MRYIEYWYIIKNCRPIKMAGYFTESRWEEFQAQPHPTQRNITIKEIK